MAINVSTVLEELADREAIKDTLHRYARAVDRLDMAVVDQIFWPEATDDHGGIASGSVYELFDNVVPAMRAMRHTQHFLSNIVIEIDGDQARTETYVCAFHGLGGEESNASLIAGGRLLDVLEKRVDEWRILHRRLVVDWVTKSDDAPVTQEDMLGLRIDGGRAPDDPSGPHFAARS